MKKTIFDLTYEEGKKLQKEFSKTSYYKQYFVGFIVTLLLLSITGLLLSIPSIFEESSYTLSVTYLIIVMGFICLFYLIFFFKTFDLMKIYYDEKKKNKD